MSDTQKPTEIFRKDYKVSNYLVDSLHLDFSINAGKTIVTSQISLFKNPESSDDNTLTLDGKSMVLQSVSLNGTVLTNDQYSITDKTLVIPNMPDKATISTTVEIVPEENKALEGLYKSGNIYCTQCESHGFRRITYFLDRPDVMTTYTVRIEADKKTCPVLLSNGNKIDQGELDNGRHFTVWQDPFKKPSYLFALVAGDLDHIHDTFTTMSGKNVDLYIYTEHGFTDQCLFAMYSLKKAMKWDEETYGREYDLELFNIVVVADFNMGAMENKSLNIFNSAAVYASQATATDVAFKYVDHVVAHEYYHNWTGDRITCRDWFQLTLKEGLTVFRHQSYMEDSYSHDVQRIEDVGGLRAMQFPEDAGPMAHPIRPESYIAMDNFYTMTVYEKGAEVIRMMKTLLGAAKYRKATDLYFERHDGQAVTCDDFVKCMEDAGDIDLSQFKLWYSQAGTPTVKAYGHYDAEMSQYTLTLEQSFPTQPHNKPMLIPVKVALLNRAGEELPLNEMGETEIILGFNDHEQEFIFGNITEKPVPSILRGFSAPVNLETNLTEDELKFLMTHGTDGFNRFEAGNVIKKRVMIDIIKTDGKTSVQPIIKALESAINDTDIDNEFKATLLGIPSQTILEQSIYPIDPLKISNTRTAVRKQIAEQLKDKLIALYNDNHSTASSDTFPTAEEMAARSLKNIALSYLSELDDGTAEKLAIAQYENATNMTDRLAALGVLGDTDLSERQEFLNDFYEKFKSDRLVIDKWFAIQSYADRSDIFEQLSSLAKHADFTLQNPNRARALHMGFAMNNPKHFHEENGKGYAFHTDALLTIDGFNPQIAARFLMPFQNWKNFAEPYRSHMKAQLDRIASQEKMSPNVSEIVGKYLG